MKERLGRTSLQGTWERNAGIADTAGNAGNAENCAGAPRLTNSALVVTEEIGVLANRYGGGAKDPFRQLPAMSALSAFYFAREVSGCLAGVASVSGWLGR
jgi:hypothetical protein